MKRILALLALSALIIAGCEAKLPTKPGGGGLPQPFNPGNGQYVPRK